MSWLVPYSDLTPDQQRAIQLSPTENRAIVGGPGSGKTQILLHRARYLCDQQKVLPERFRIFVYTNALKDYIKTALRELNLPDDSVTTFDNWCNQYYKSNISPRIPWGEHRPDFDSVRRSTLAHAGKGGVLFDFVLVDEGQDLPEEVFTFLTKVSKHVTVCIDNKQQIYDIGTTEAGVYKALNIRRRNISLIDAFRVSPYLVTVASQFIDDPSDREAFLNQTRQPQTEKQTPLIYYARDFEDEKEMLHRLVQERLLKNERIAILFPDNRRVYGFAVGLTDMGIEVEVPPKRGKKSELPTHDFSSPLPKLMTYHSVKGLTFDTVFMPRLIRNAFGKHGTSIVNNLLFVAITRATRWCCFLTTNDNSLDSIQNKLLPLEAENKISVIKHDNTKRSGDSESTLKPVKDDLDFL